MNYNFGNKPLISAIKKTLSNPIEHSQRLLPLQHWISEQVKTRDIRQKYNCHLDSPFAGNFYKHTADILIGSQEDEARAVISLKMSYVSDFNQHSDEHFCHMLGEAINIKAYQTQKQKRYGCIFFLEKTQFKLVESDNELKRLDIRNKDAFLKLNINSLIAGNRKQIHLYPDFINLVLFNLETEEISYPTGQTIETNLDYLLKWCSDLDR